MAAKAPPVDGMFLPGALSDCDLAADACRVAPVPGWPVVSEQLLAPRLPTSKDAQSWLATCGTSSGKECCVREPVAAAAAAAAAAAGTSTGNVQDGLVDDLMAASVLSRAHNRRYAADRHARQRATLAAAQQEARDSVVEIDFWKACISELPGGPSILAKSERKLLVRNAVASMSPRARMAAFRIHRFWRDVCYDPAYAHARALVLRQLDT